MPAPSRLPDMDLDDANVRKSPSRGFVHLLATALGRVARR
jgi:hypothetical protein